MGKCMSVQNSAPPREQRTCLCMTDHISRNVMEERCSNDILGRWDATCMPAIVARSFMCAVCASFPFGIHSETLPSGLGGAHAEKRCGMFHPCSLLSEQILPSLKTIRRQLSAWPQARTCPPLAVLSYPATGNFCESFFWPPRCPAQG